MVIFLIWTVLHKHVKISVDEWILETTRPQKHVKFLEQYILSFTRICFSKITKVMAFLSSFFFCSPSQSPNVIWHFLYQHHCRCGAMPASYISNTYMIQPLLKHHHIIANIYNQYCIAKAVWVDYRDTWVMKSQGPKKHFITADSEP